MKHPLIIAAGTTLVAASSLLAGSFPGALEPDGGGAGARAETRLEMSVRKLDPEGSRKMGLMYMPSTASLAPERPDGIRKEPQYQATPRYAVITLGNAAENRYILVIDEPEDKDPRFYADLNHNGDLTDDGDGSWEKVERAEGRAPSLASTRVFQVRWENSDGTSSTGEYALNFYRSVDRDTINYYRASARTGTIEVGGKKYEVMLHENDNDGLFNKLYDPSKPTPADKLPKPVTLSLDGDRLDIRGTFGFGDYNYIARVSDDGSKLVLEPTMRQIRLPRPAERPEMLGAGRQVPEFEAVWWKPGSSEPSTFKISDFKGKSIVVLDMWATWCGPCMRGLPHLSKVAEEAAPQGVEVIALNVWDETAAYERFAREKGGDFAFKLARDPAGRERDASIASRLFTLRGIPATYVIDKNGKIEAAVSGYSPDDRQVEHALVRLGVKIKGIDSEAAEKAKPAAPGRTVPMTGLK